MDTIIKYNTKIMVSRYNNKQLTIYSNEVATQCNSYGMIIPFSNRANKEPTILNTIVEDNKIFKMIDNCFSNKPTIFENLMNSLYDIRLNKFAKRSVSSPKNLDQTKVPVTNNDYLPVVYHNNYKYSIAKNSKDLKKINTTELNFYLAQHNIMDYDNHDDYGFIVFWIQNTNTPLAVITMIEDNQFFIPTKDFYLYTFFNKITVKQFSNNDLINIMNSNQMYKNTSYFFTNMSNYVEEQPRESTDSNDSIDNDCENKYINYKIYVLHSSTDISVTVCPQDSPKRGVLDQRRFETAPAVSSSLGNPTDNLKVPSKGGLFSGINEKKCNNANNPFNSNITCDSTIGKYLKSCSSKKMFKIETNNMPDNLWFNVANNKNDIIIY
jgi:hypothetical protein